MEWPSTFPKPDPTKKVALVGFASSSRDEAPFADASFEIWGLNHLYNMIPRWSRWFEMHTIAHLSSDQMRDGQKQNGVEHLDYLKALPGPGAEGHRPVYMQRAFPEIPASVEWPRGPMNECLKALGAPEDYFTSSISQMLTVAMLAGFGEIHLYGIDLAEESEYAYQRPGAEYLIGIATGLGAKVVLPRKSALLKANYVYGFTEPPASDGSVKPILTWLEGQLEDLNKHDSKMAATMATLHGGQQGLEWIRLWLATDEGKAAVVDGRLSVEALSAAMAKRDGEWLAGRTQAQNAAWKVAGAKEMISVFSTWVAHYGRGGVLP
jgi:hypothetical protein